MSINIDPGKGYRLLEHGEILVETDECWHRDSNWLPTYSVGSKIGDYSIRNEAYRRKIDPGKGYRLLEDGEVILNDDEYLSTGIWEPLRVWRKETFDSKLHLPHRRRKIDPGKGYRLLEPGETKQKGDEFWCKTDQKWKITEEAGVVYSGGMTYRRKIQPVETPKDESLLKQLEEAHKEIANLKNKEQALEEENRKLQKHLQDRDETIRDLKFALRKIRQNET